MRRILAFAAAVGALTVAACDDPYADEDLETAQPPLEEPVAPAAEDAAADAAAAAPEDAPPPVDQSAIPADKRTSEESVQPESETLFY
ncbi:hypothetical protein [Brevundimonas viscosa]|uniref:Uncharacterized protein n=1 Tax=Brevundimonas viscosa TaxID=871741 RepID=A0A1I6S0W6_9CAUL|nr:hypothetical protein [Brevundimonas viscosa]SFS70589.1 hypothetical protein SAMN05192570_2073 [Brevundimonas viscosa]